MIDGCIGFINRSHLRLISHHLSVVTLGTCPRVSSICVADVIYESAEYISINAAKEKAGKMWLIDHVNDKIDYSYR
jgi:hypothetical protein